MIMESKSSEEVSSLKSDTPAHSNEDFSDGEIFLNETQSPHMN